MGSGSQKGGDGRWVARPRALAMVSNQRHPPRPTDLGVMVAAGGSEAGTQAPSLHTCLCFSLGLCHPVAIMLPPVHRSADGLPMAPWRFSLGRLSAGRGLVFCKSGVHGSGDRHESERHVCWGWWLWLAWRARAEGSGVSADAFEPWVSDHGLVQ